MIPQQIAAPGVVSFNDLKPLAAANGLCITVAAPIPNPAEVRTRLKNMILGVETKLADRGADPATASVLLERIHALAAVFDMERKWANSLIVFRSCEIFRHYWVQRSPNGERSIPGSAFDPFSEQ